MEGDVLINSSDEFLIFRLLKFSKEKIWKKKIVFWWILLVVI